jgi:predicted metalloendopeptidase
MLVDIQWAFSSLVRSADWMDEETKIATLEKAAAVKHFVGFPEWLLNRDQLEAYYEGVSKRCPRLFVNVVTQSIFNTR